MSTKNSNARKSLAIMGEDSPDALLSLLVDSGDVSLCDIIELSQEIEDLRLEPRQAVKEAILNYANR